MKTALLIVLLLSITVFSQQTFWANLTVSSSTGAATTIHTFTATFQNYSLPANSYIIVAYTNQFTTTSANTPSPNNNFCQTGCTISSASIAQSPPSSLRINGLFTSPLSNANFTVQYSIGNLINPLYQGTQNIVFSVFNNANVLINSTTLSTLIYAASMTCSVSPANTLVSSASAYTFTVTPHPSIPLPETGSLRLFFPSRWANSLVSGTLSYSSCTSATCSALSSNSLSATNLFIQASRTTAFSFIVTQVTNPATTQPNSQTTIVYLLPNGTRASTCFVTISGLQTLNMPVMDFRIGSGQGILNFTTVTAPTLSDSVAVTFPAQLLVGDTLNYGLSVNNGASSPYTDQVITRPGSNQIVLFRIFKSTALASISITFKPIRFTMPVSATTQVRVQLMRNNFAYSSAQCCSLSNNATQTNTASLVLTSSLMGANTNYVISFSPAFLPDYFIINFGSQYSLTTGSSLNCYFDVLINRALLNCTVISNTQLRIALINSSLSFGNYLGYSNVYNLTLVGIPNPSFLSSTLSMTSYQLPSQVLQSSNTISTAFIPARLISAVVQPTSLTVGAVTSYTITINNTNTLQPSSLLHLYFPSVYSLSSPNCLINAVSTTCVPSTSTYLQFTLPNVLVPQYGLPTYSLTIDNIRNPPSTKPTDSFRIYLQSASTVVQGLTQAVTVAMSTVTSFTMLTVTPNNTRVGELARYTIQFTHGLNINNGTITLVFTLPIEYTLASCSACSSHQTFTITSADTQVVIDRVYNPQQTTVSGSIGVSLLVDGYQAVTDTVPSPSFDPLTLPFSILSNSSFMGQAVQLNFTINSVPLSARQLIINIPAQYSLSSLSLSSTWNISHSLSGSILIITINNMIGNQLRIQLNGLINPTTISSAFWSITANTASSILIGSSTNNFRFTATCGSICRQCDNSTHCLSCYNNPLVNALSLLNQPTNLCVASCTSTQFQFNSTCYNCHSSCSTCSLFASNCTACPSTSFLIQGNCISSCPQTHYSSGNVCLRCISPCHTCSSISICISCISGHLLQTDSSCAIGCGANQYNYSNICTACPANCSSCNTDGCTNCNAGFYPFQLSLRVCLPQCLSGSYLSANSSLCQTCQLPCLTCSISSNNCSSCNQVSSQRFLSNFMCLSSCPNNTYSDTSNTCHACSSPCLSCSSSVNCTTCASPFLFYAATNQCVSVCFGNTVNVSNTCQQCQSPCLTCIANPSTCTSCIQNYFLQGSLCVITCTAPLVGYNGFCAACYSPCSTCLAGQPLHCLSCIVNYRIFSNTCYSVCPTHTYANTLTTCASCTAPCAQCSLSPTNCTHCYQLSYLLNNQCYSPCPPTYFPQGSICQRCQSQCFSCPYSASDQCSTCANSSLLFNPITYHCTFTCTHPYYSNTLTRQCLLCQLPCKTCINSPTTCASCYQGRYLLASTCITSCPSTHYANQSSNTCINCPSLCVTCDFQQCFTCTTGSLFLYGNCYSSCPPVAPYPYLNLCRNCLRQNCQLCNSNGQCSLCFPSFYTYASGCVSACPSSYQIDNLTLSKCILKPTVAYLQFVQGQQHHKILIMPASTLLLLSLPLMCFASSALFALAFLLTIPQCVAFVQIGFHYNSLYTMLQSPQLPSWLFVALAGALICISLTYTIIFRCFLNKSDSFRQWLQFGNNSYRVNIITIFSCINKQAFYILFSGLFNLPFTSFTYSSPPCHIPLHILNIIIWLILVGIGAIGTTIQQTNSSSLRLFYAFIDLAAIFLISIIFQIVFLCKASKQPPPPAYHKYIIPKVSVATLPALSQPPEQPQVPVDHNRLHRSNSDQDIFQSKQMKDVDFLSQIDDEDYFDQTPQMDLENVQEGLHNGDFRKKNKKKRGRRRQGKLGVIQQLSDQDEDQKKDKKGADKKKKVNGQRKNVGYLNNYIYWKQPTKKKKNPGKVFKQNQKSIMLRINQKESQFDTITNNDIVFQEWNDSSDQEQRQNESRRALQKPTYDNYFNLHYASKKHLI